VIGRLPVLEQADEDGDHPWCCAVGDCHILLLAGSAGARREAFGNYTLAQSPSVVCPGSAKCKNPAAEPSIRADPVGELYASSENGLGNGTEA
jgi:hypothetical protein